MKFKLPAIFFVAFMSVACSNENNTPDHLSINSFETLPMEMVFEFTESENVVFQSISSVKSDNYGNILVHDFRQPFLFMFDQEGNFLKRIGREGHGPGEFQQIRSFLVAQDYLWIIDSNTMKIEEFEYQANDYVNINTLSLEDEDLAGLFIGKAEEGILIRKSFIINANRRDNPTEVAISLIDEEGDILRDIIFTIPVKERITARSSGNTLNTSKSFGNESLLAYDGKSRIYTLWTDSLSIDTYTIDGNRQRAFSHPLKPVGISGEERDSVLNVYDNIFRADLRRQLPDVKPIVNNFIIDDHQRIWVELLTEELGNGWFCFTEEGEPLYKIDIPKSGAELQEISRNRMLWNYLNENGAPTFAVSEINIPEI